MTIKRLPTSGLYSGQEQCFELDVPDNYTLTAVMIPATGATVPATVTKSDEGIVCVTVPENVNDQNYRLEVTACPS